MGRRYGLTTEQALSLISDKEYIHTFISLPNVLIGAEWKREDIVRAIYEHSCEMGGEMCRKMGHGLAILKGNDPMFVEVDDDALDKFDVCKDEE